MIREDRHYHRMTHHAVGFSMPRDNQPPNRTACHLASQVVRIREMEGRRTARRTFRVLHKDRIQTALWTIIISLSLRSLKSCSEAFAMQMAIAKSRRAQMTASSRIS
jgi:hypothetical protein